MDTLDSERFEILDIFRCGKHVVLRVKYPNCAKCSYEGEKVMAFLNASESQIVRWKKMDPHFREPSPSRPERESPGPDARFPASKEGWNDAVEYIQRKANMVTGP